MSDGVLSTVGAAPAVALAPGAGRDGRALPSASRVPTTLGAAVDRLAPALDAAGTAGARREACAVLAALLDVGRAWPAAHPDAPLAAEVWAAAAHAVGCLVRGMPFAYAVGRAAFRHLTLDVDARVLIPRPETELLVDLVLAGAQGGVVVDVGTGAGAIALALASEGAYTRVLATDVSDDALAVARRNAGRLAARLRSPIEFLHGSLLAPLGGRMVQAVVSNPPYVADGEAASLPAAVRDWEPPLALFSGADGLRATRRLVREAAVLLEPGGLLALEVDSQRAQRVAACAANDGRYCDVAVQRDLTGRERFVTARRTAVE